MGRRRTQADRDAITIEIGYAFVSACFAAALAFGAVYGPALAFSLPPSTRGTLAVAGGILAAAVFLLRITHVLLGFARRPENDGR
ncbi:DUF6332 family protein [Streptomyces nojiriensis]|uniref:Uncharacterized protein n=1 Tax=Streptomyces nojiriensis TaxID=66374 RepID=A0ABQ3SPW0_9ACTN|nr:DUF6332 family protein [Streptomyces nojiriensis]QTI43714.1 hypothetical protein JYK04_01477 [Streptomyces nojiriensis]GGR83087.1 hypothetical protein GCM10010205_09610 [Streptomyces nojiriensis]GHI70178.1 hypothetical protein Snoj_40960 [Streptomyces nojiriensis]